MIYKLLPQLRKPEQKNNKPPLSPVYELIVSQVCQDPFTEQPTVVQLYKKRRTMPPQYLLATTQEGDPNGEWSISNFPRYIGREIENTVREYKKYGNGRISGLALGIAFEVLAFLAHKYNSGTTLQIVSMLAGAYFGICALSPLPQQKQLKSSIEKRIDFVFKQYRNIVEKEPKELQDLYIVD